MKIELKDLEQLFRVSYDGVFQMLRPVPDTSDWFQAHIQAWGTSRDIYPPDIDPDTVRPESIIHFLDLTQRPNGYMLEVAFDTVESPPIPVLRELQNRGFNVECTYREWNGGTAGDWRNGQHEQYRCRVWKIPANASHAAQTVCEAVILQFGILYYVDGVPHRLDPEACGIIDGDEVVFGCVRGNALIDPPERSNWTAVPIEDIAPVFRIWGRRAITAYGLPDGVMRPEFTQLYVTSEAFRTNCEPLWPDEYDD